MAEAPLERLKQAMNHHAVYDEIAVALVRPSDLAAAIAAIEAMMARHEIWTRETYGAVQESITRLTTPGE